MLLSLLLVRNGKTKEGILQDEDVCKERDWLPTQALLIGNIISTQVGFLVYLLFSSPHFSSLCKSLQNKDG